MYSVLTFSTSTNSCVSIYLSKSAPVLWMFLMYGVTGQLVFLVEGVPSQWFDLELHLHFGRTHLDSGGPTHPTLDRDQPSSFYPLSSNPINHTPVLLGFTPPESWWLLNFGSITSSIDHFKFLIWLINWVQLIFWGGWPTSEDIGVASKDKTPASQHPLANMWCLADCAPFHYTGNWHTWDDCQNYDN